jgi:crotonobetainyl-CoA:carnitine CoA-transferase CaiB-like acyl-CoA transferase
LLDRLAEKADVLIWDGSAPELDALRWSNLGDGGATKVRAAITPFGFNGPYRNWKASGPVLLAMGGYSWLMGDQGVRRSPCPLGRSAEEGGESRRVKCHRDATASLNLSEKLQHRALGPACT